MSRLFLLTTDLMFSSKVAGAARALGMDLRVAGSPAELIERVSAGGVDLVLLDLVGLGDEAVELIGNLRRLEPAPKAIVGYGPHVQESVLQAAAEAGCDEVLSRGKFDAKMNEILSRFVDQLGPDYS